MEPEQLPEFVHEMAGWARRSGPLIWAAKAAQGSPFYWPPGVTDPSKDALALREEVYGKTLRRTQYHHLAHTVAVEAQRDSTLTSYRQLADHHATTLERAHLFYIGKDIAYLAGRTEMRDFRLDRDLLYLDPIKKTSLMTCGFMMWQTPIGEAEPRGKLTAQYHVRTGELLEVEVTDDVMEGFRDSETPVNALSWRILPDGKNVLLVFYSDGNKVKEAVRRHIEEQKASLPPGASLDEAMAQHAISDPQPLEREQVIPLDTTLAWFEDKDAEHRLKATILSDPSFLREAERRHVAKDFIEANEKILPMLSQMVKTFVATLAVRRMKLATREEVAPSRASVKRMRRDGASEERQQGRVQVVRIGGQLKRKTKDGGSGGGKWRVKTIIGPVIRTRQYVPAYDEYRDGVRMIEPYVAGPEDAPWSKNVKVFLLEGDALDRSAAPEPVKTDTTRKKGTKSERRPDDTVTFSVRNPVADFIERMLPGYEHNSAEAFAARRHRGTTESTFTVTRYAALTLVVEVGYLLEDVTAGKIDAAGLKSPVESLRAALDSIRSAADMDGRA